MKSVCVMMKPASGQCNMRCSYCFYLDECGHRETKFFGRMELSTLEAVVSKALSAAELGCSFAFQGGEPTLAGLPFFREYVALVEKYNTKKLVVQSAIQTNGILIDEEWAEFLAENHFLVGLSCDGIRETHDRNRRFPDGGGTFGQVMKASELMNRHHVEYNILTVVTPQLAEKIGKVYRFYLGQGLNFQQYIPCIAPIDAPRADDCTLTGRQYGKFLCRLFDLWYQDFSKGKQVSIRFFDNLVGMFAGIPPEACGMLGCCQTYYLTEADGSVYPCDFYAMDGYLLGNFNTHGFEELDASRKKLRFSEDSVTQEEKCGTCRWLAVCRGGCRRDRDFLGTGELGLNRYCEGYDMFYAHAAPRLRELGQGLAAQRRP